MGERAGLRLRITTFATLVVGAALVVGSVVLVVLLRNGLVHSVAGTGPRHAAEIAALAQAGPLPDPLPPLDTPRRTLLQVIGRDGRVLASSAPLQGLTPLASGDRRARRSSLPNGLRGSWLIEPTAAVIGREQATVVVVTSLDGLTGPASLLAELLAVGLPVVLAFVAFVSWRMVGRALGPVEVMRAEVADITATRLDRRVPIPAADDEVTRLARTLNDMLDRLQRSDDAQRRFVADASHEMRTPLANMRTALEVARSHPETSTWDDVGADVLDQTARLQRLVDDLLQLAHAEARGDRRTDQPVDLAALAREEAEAPRRVAVEVDAPSAVIIDGNVDQLASAMRNLLDNAARHAEAQVHVVVADRGGAAELVVSDDGPGIASSDRERIFERFVRLDGHRGRAPNDPGGAGVGLAIVRRVALAHGGTAVATDPDGLGGARLVVRIPH